MSKSTEAATPEVLPATKEADQPLNELTSAGTAPVFAVVKAVTRPVLRFGVQPEYIRVESPMYQGDPMEKSKIKAIPTLLEVFNLKTGEAMLMVCAEVFKQEILRNYPKDAYVGKDFQIRKIKVDGKDYALWAIAEIEVK